MGIVVIGVLAVLSVPIMLIVALVNLSWIEDQLSSLCKKIEIADASRNLKSVPNPSALTRLEYNRKLEEWYNGDE